MSDKSKKPKTETKIAFRKEDKTGKRIDETIENICEWIDANLDEHPDTPQMTSDIVFALAELISARNNSAY